MIAKVIVTGRTRSTAIKAMRQVLETTMLVGPKTTIPLQLSILKQAEFASGSCDTKYVEHQLQRLLQEAQ